jgi:hypothetical protein
MGAFDDIVSGAAPVGTPGGTYDDLVSGPTQDPNSLHLDFGFGYGTDVQVPWGLQNLAKGLTAIDDNLMTPLARGMANTAGFLVDSAYTGVMAPEKPVFGTSSQYLQETLGIDPRPADAGTGTDVLEAVGGGLLGGAVGNLATGAGTAVPTMLREGVTALTSTLGGYFGGDVGEYLGGEQGRVAGQTLGSLGGGALPSAGHATAVKPVVRAGFSKPGPHLPDGRTPSRAAYDDLEAAGISPRPGLVGNDGMAMVENSIASLPIVGNIPLGRIQNTMREFQQNLYDTAGRISGRNTPVPPNNQVPQTDIELGARMRASAAAGEQNLKQQQNRSYTEFFNQVPQETLVTPNNMRAVSDAQLSKFNGGESPATNAAIQDFVHSNLYGNDQVSGSLVGQQGPTRPGMPYPGIEGQPPSDMPASRVGPMAPGEPLRQGVPFDLATKMRTEAIYDASKGKMKGGAVDQVKQGITADIEDAILNDPASISRMPDLAERQALVERLRVLDTEYRMSKATDVSRQGGKFINGRFYVGGDYPALKEIMTGSNDPERYSAGSKPGGMAVIQRTLPPTGTDPNVGYDYGSLAGDTIINKSKMPKPKGPINVSPGKYTSWWNNLDENSKAIYANEGYTPGRSWSADEIPVTSGGSPRMNELDNLSRAGEHITNAGENYNFSKTMPTISTIAMLTGLLYDPVTVSSLMAGKTLAGGIASSPELARILASIGPGKLQETLQGVARSLPATISHDPDNNPYGGPR